MLYSLITYNKTEAQMAFEIHHNNMMPFGTSWNVIYEYMLWFQHIIDHGMRAIYKGRCDYIFTLVSCCTFIVAKENIRDTAAVNSLAKPMSARHHRHLYNSSQTKLCRYFRFNNESIREPVADRVPNEFILLNAFARFFSWYHVTVWFYMICSIAVLVICRKHASKY